MITTTTPTIAEREIAATLGVVTGEAIIGANIFRDLLASLTDIVGGRSATYERSLREARDVAGRHEFRARNAVSVALLEADELDLALGDRAADVGEIHKRLL